MTFEGQYLTYSDYIALGGSQMDTTPFNLLEFEARRKIDENTFNRLKNLSYEEIPQEVKLCEYNLINSLKAYQQSISQSAINGHLKSENTDGYSVSYGTASDISTIVQSKNDELEDVIRTYLLGVVVNGEHIMYCGVD